jgi:UDP-3-O-[3-hydroxymyristoyl] N-acetylglucosamine deacetylase
MLDAVGDLALAGAPVIGRYCGVKSGHDMTNRLLHKLFSTPGAWRYDIVKDRASVSSDCVEPVRYVQAVVA